MEKDKIKFRPLHEGMGFHPFSDGLPYAPESKTKYQNGVGANAAGRPQFVNPSSSLPNQSKTVVRTARQIQEQQNLLNSKTPAQAPLRSSAKTAASVNEISLLRTRAFAYLMDSVIHSGFWLSTNLAAFFFFRFQVDSEILKDYSAQFLLFFLISQWLFIGLQEVLFGNSIGKVFFNLEFKRNHSSLFLRSFVFMVGLLALGAGLLYRPQDKLGEIQLKSKNILSA